MTDTGYFRALTLYLSVRHAQKEFAIRTEPRGVAGKVFQAAGVALPAVLQNTSAPATAGAAASRLTNHRRNDGIHSIHQSRTDIISTQSRQKPFQAI
jgi:hypothetical protein